MERFNIYFEKIHSHFRDENGYSDVATSIHVHDALEKEFGIDVKDRLALVTDVETAFYIVMSHHDPMWRNFIFICK